MRVKLLTKEIARKLAYNGQKAGDHAPVVKIFTPDAQATWLFSESDPQDPDLVFGLCDLGMGTPELGYARLSEIAAVRGKFRLPPERDRHIQFPRPLSEYAEASRNAGRMVDRL